MAITRESILNFSEPVDPFTVDSNSIKILVNNTEAFTHLEVSPDQHTVTIFYQEQLPGFTEIVVLIDGDLLKTAEGEAVDPDNDGIPGGQRFLTFRTLDTASVPGTVVVGRVFASELRNSQSAKTTVNTPLAGVTITVDGNDGLSAVTDSMGNFRLENAPAGEFFVHIDGRTVTSAMINGELVATNFPDGPYFPFVGKNWKARALQTNDIGDVYLPLVVEGSLTSVSNTEDTTIAFPQTILDEFPEFEGVELTVPAGALYDNNGFRGGRVGIAPVPPDRLPGPLPEALNFPLVITVQTAATFGFEPAPTNFAEPAPICFPNLPDPETGEILPPGAKSGLWSFDHDEGRFKLAGSMTVSEDGLLICTDPGVGVLEPGWHGSDPSGEVSSGDPDKPRDDDNDPNTPPPDSNTEQKSNCLRKILQASITCLANAAGLANPLRCLTASSVGGFNVTNNCVIDQNPLTCAFALTATAGTILARCVYQNTPPAKVIAISFAAVKCAGGVVGAAKSCLSSSSSKGLAQQEEFDFPALEAYITQLEFEIQRLEDYVAVQTTVFGDTAWLEIPPRQTPLYDELLVKIDAFQESGSEEAEKFSPTEVNELLAMDRPDLITRDRVLAYTDRHNRSIDYYMLGILNVEDVPDGMSTDFVPLDVMGDALARSQAAFASFESENRIGIFDGLDEVFRDFYPLVRQELEVAPSNEKLHYWVVSIDSDFEMRGTTSEEGKIEGLILDVDRYFIRWVSPTDFQQGIGNFAVSQGGQQIELEPPVLLPSENIDSDGDGIPDEAEPIFGTNSAVADTDGDGTDDLTEIRDGTDPLDEFNGFGIGPLGNLNLNSFAQRVAVENNIAVVYSHNGGSGLISILNVFGARPALVEQLALGPNRQFKDFAIGEDKVIVCYSNFDPNLPGAEVIDVSNPLDIKITPIAGLTEAESVALFGDRAVINGFTPDGFGMAIYDLQENLLLNLAAAIPFARVIGIDGDVAFALGNNAVESFRLDPLEGLLPISSGASYANVPSSGLAAGGIAYLSNTNSLSYVDVSDPAAITPLNEFVLNTPGTIAGFADGRILLGFLSAFNIVDARNPEVFSSPAFFPTVVPFQYPSDITVYNGEAYLAEGQGGLTAYRFFDPVAALTTPTITISTTNTTDSIAPGDLLFLTASAEDEQLVRRVEFYLNDRLAFTDANYPFTTAISAPTSDTFTVRARAVDFEGITAWSNVIEFETVLPAGAPQLVYISPLPGGTIEANRQEATVTFDQLIDPESIAGIELVSAGPDLTLGTADDQAVSGVSAGTPSLLPLVRIRWQSPLSPGLYRLQLPTSITGLNSQPIAANDDWTFTVTAP